ARRELRDADDEGDERQRERLEVGASTESTYTVVEDRQASHEADEQSDQGEHAFLSHRSCELGKGLQPFSRPPSPPIPAGSPANSSVPQTIRRARKTSEKRSSRTNSRSASFADGPLKATSETPAARTTVWKRSGDTVSRPGATTQGPISHASPLGFPTMTPWIAP